MILQQYIEKADQLVNEALKIRLDTPHPWKYLKTQGNMKTFYKPSVHYKGNMYKFTMELDYPQQLIYSIMKPPKTTEERLSWDKSLHHYELLDSITEEIAVGCLVTPPAMLGMVSKREFVDLYVYKTFTEDGNNPAYGVTSWIFAESIEHPKRPLSSDCIRGKNFPGGFAVAQNKADLNKCFLELYTNCEIGGMLPRSIVETALPSQQLSYIESVKAEAKRRVGY